MKKRTEKTIYKEEGKGKVTFVTDNVFGDNHYIVYDKEGCVLGRFPLALRIRKTWSEILDLYLKEGNSLVWNLL